MKITKHIIEKSLKDHAVEWSATVFSVVGALINAHTYIEGFYIWGVSNILWAWFAVKYKHWGLLTLNIIFAVINIIGIYTWTTTGFGNRFF